MVLNSTHFVSCNDIDVDEIDPYEDAWGLNAEFVDVLEALGHLDLSPGEGLTRNLMEKIRKID